MVETRQIPHREIVTVHVIGYFRVRLRLFLYESSCKTFYVRMGLIFKKMKL